MTLRHQEALLLGYNTHADYMLEVRMAKSPQKVVPFLRLVGGGGDDDDLGITPGTRNIQIHPPTHPPSHTETSTPSSPLCGWRSTRCC